MSSKRTKKTKTVQYKLGETYCSQKQKATPISGSERRQWVSQDGLRLKHGELETGLVWRKAEKSAMKGK